MRFSRTRLSDVLDRWHSALRRARPALTELEAAAGAAKALADPARLAVAVELRDREEQCVCDLAWVCERSDKLVSHHARALRAAGLVTSRRQCMAQAKRSVRASVVTVSDDR
jgi:DNA-binding transcriptional ArsR family regulator